MNKKELNRISALDAARKLDELGSGHDPIEYSGRETYVSDFNSNYFINIKARTIRIRYYDGTEWVDGTLLGMLMDRIEYQKNKNKDDKAELKFQDVYFESKHENTTLSVLKLAQAFGLLPWATEEHIKHAQKDMVVFYHETNSAVDIIENIFFGPYIEDKTEVDLATFVGLMLSFSKEHKPTTFKLNNAYSAKLDFEKQTIEVGCQTFEMDTFEDFIDFYEDAKEDHRKF